VTKVELILFSLDLFQIHSWIVVVYGAKVSIASSEVESVVCVSGIEWRDSSGVFYTFEKVFARLGLHVCMYGAVESETDLAAVDSEGKMALRRMRVAMFLACLTLGIGTSIALNGVLSGVGYFAMRFGESSFIWITSALYMPAFPIAVAVTWSKVRMETLRKDGQSPEKQLWSDGLRIFIAFVISSVMMILTSVVRREGPLLVICIIVGVCQSLGLENALQLLKQAKLTNKNGELEAALFLGFQGSSVVCLVAELCTGFDPMSPRSEVHSYFWTLAAVASLAIFGMFFLIRIGVEQISMESSEGINEPLITLVEAEQEDVENESEQVIELTWRDAFGQCRACGLSLFTTVFASMVCFPFYSFVPSSSPGMPSQARLAVVLFYVKSFSDTLARPATVIFPKLVENPKSLLVLSVLRMFIFLPFFFAYVFGDIRKNDFVIAIAIGIFSASAGYFNTLSLQLVPSLGKSEASVRKMTTLMNAFFQMSFFFGVGFAIILRALILAPKEDPNLIL